VPFFVGGAWLTPLAYLLSSLATRVPPANTCLTHCALFGVNPWRLQTWLGHKRIDETMLYVHIADAHAREWPEHVHEAARSEVDPDKRIVAMLAARSIGRGSRVAAKTATSGESAAIVAA
jgi:hypothetical protein